MPLVGKWLKISINKQVHSKSIALKKFWDEFTHSTIFADGNKK